MDNHRSSPGCPWDSGLWGMPSISWQYCGWLPPRLHHWLMGLMEIGCCTFQVPPCSLTCSAWLLNWAVLWQSACSSLFRLMNTALAVNSKLVKLISNNYRPIFIFSLSVYVEGCGRGMQFGVILLYLGGTQRRKSKGSWRQYLKLSSGLATIKCFKPQHLCKLQQRDPGGLSFLPCS